MRAQLSMAMSTATVVALASLASPAHAGSLYFEKVAVQTSSERTCLSFASTAARTQGLSNVHKSNSEVAGEKDGAYVAMTCIGRSGQPAVAVVMSIADDFGVAKAAGHMLSESVKGVVCTDSPC